MDKTEIKKILEDHEKWLSNEPGGKRADLSGADLKYANLGGANLRHANLIGADLIGADLSGADLRHANLIGTNLRHADLSGADLRHADLSGADLSGTNLRHADLSGTKNFLSPIDYMNENFERTEEGFIVYKTFGYSYPSPKTWNIECGSVISETADWDRTNLCGCGINVAPLDWVKKHQSGLKIYKLLIKWEWLMGVVIPYNTDGKIRCERAMILEELND